MNDIQKARYDAAKRIQIFNSDYAVDIAGTITEYPDEQNPFDKAIDEIEKAQQAQATNNKGQATGKENLLQTMADVMVQFSQRGVVKAHNAGNTTLETGLDHAAFYYTQPSGDEAISRANAVLGLISNNLPILTNISAANVVTMQGAIDDFSAVKNTPTASRQTQKVMGTDQIEPLLDTIDVYMKHMHNLINSYFPKSTMSEDFDLKEKLIILGIRHNYVVMHLADSTSGTAIVNGTAATSDGKKTATTDNTGAATLDNVATGTKDIVVSAPGYASQTITVKVIRGTHTEVVVKMVKV